MNTPRPRAPRPSSGLRLAPREKETSLFRKLIRSLLAATLVATLPLLAVRLIESSPTLDPNGDD
jgi:hypothetical protein